MLSLQIVLVAFSSGDLIPFDENTQFAAEVLLRAPSKLQIEAN